MLHGGDRARPRSDRGAAPPPQHGPVAATDLITDRHVLHVSPVASSIAVRAAEQADAGAVAAIDNQGIAERAATFRHRPGDDRRHA